MKLASGIADLRDAQLRALYDHFPGIIFAPSAGGLFTGWVLWGHVNTSILLVLLFLAVLLSVVRFFWYRKYLELPRDVPLDETWRHFALVTSLLSGATWGSFALFLYPSVDQSYEVYLTILLSLVPVAPVAALATYLPCFYVYYIPAAVPFLVVLASQNNRAGWTSATLATILMIATLQFARQFYKSLTEAELLRLEARDNSVRLEQSLKDRNQFMVDANHDLRQPLQALDLSIGSQDAHADAPTKRQLQIARLAVATLKDYLERLRDVTKFEALATKPEPEKFSVGRELEDLVTIFEPMALEKEIDLRFVPTRLWVYADRSAFKMIVRNLLENAITHSPQNAKVLLGCLSRKDKVQVVVMDNGPGIALADQSRVFEDFIQLENPTRDNTKGIGLGLSIAKRAAFHTGGEIRLISEPGKGSSFSLFLPKVEAGDTPADMVTGSGSITFAEPADILVLEGEASIRDGLLSVFSNWGLNPVGCDTTIAAKKIISDGFSPAALIVDYRLEPDLSGLEAWSALKDHLGRELPFIVVTGDTDPAIEKEVEEASGFFFLKPVDVGALAVVLQTVLR